MTDLVKDHEQVVQLAVEVAADGHLLRDGRGSLVEVGQSLQFGLGLRQDAGHVLGVQSVVLLLAEEIDQGVQVLLRQREVDVRPAVRRLLGARDSLLLGQLVRLVGELGVEGLCVVMVVVGVWRNEIRDAPLEGVRV